ncbi:ABC transporter permease [Anaerofilum sp. BX8]|uniref:ABC transporter permease n=1 Tax=Anaerofilum hominis TaxID=2763016 RepID=A0A923I6H7_9FIRM|nr:ABC transporter permease [Anaerofilum hominis]MBC5581208.1 ABC transporter permease [Anaerofilum hominis]
MNTKVKKSESSLISQLLMGNKALFILLALILIMAFASPVFFTSDNLLNVVRQVAYSAVMGAGFTLVLGSGHMDLSIGCMVGFVGVIMGKAMESGLPVPVAILVGIIAGSLCGALNASVITLFDLPPFIVTLATMSVYKGSTYLITKMVPISNLPSSFVFLGQGYIGPIPVPIYIMALMVLVMYILLTRTMFGRHAIAMGGNAEATRVSGIDTKKVRLGVYMTMGVYVAIASVILTARSASAQIAAGQNTEMDAIAAVVIGGTPLSGGSANVLGTLVGCLIVGVVNNSLNLLGADSNWQIIAKGVLILFAIILDVVWTKMYANMAKKKEAAAK